MGNAAPQGVNDKPVMLFYATFCRAADGMLNFMKV